MSFPDVVLNGEVWGHSSGLGTQWEWSKGHLSPLHFSPYIPNSFLCPLFYSGLIATLENCPVVLKSPSGREGTMSQGSPPVSW